MFEVQLKGDVEVIKKFQTIPGMVVSGAEGVTQEAAANMVELVRAFASQRPGPEVQSGEYIDSILAYQLDRTTWTVGTDAPQAMRLEYGFVGVDAIGRHYAQPPYPHWTPATLVMYELYPQMFGDMVERVIANG